VRRIASASALFSEGGGAQIGVMVMRDRPQALFQPRMHPKRTAVEIVSALEAGLKKSGEKSGLAARFSVLVLLMAWVDSPSTGATRPVKPGQNREC